MVKIWIIYFMVIKADMEIQRSVFVFDNDDDHGGGDV